MQIDHVAFHIGDEVELLSLPPSRRHLRPGQRGIVAEVGGLWGGVAVHWHGVPGTPGWILPQHVRPVPQEER